MPGEIERLRGIKNETLQSVTDLKRSVTELENTEDEALREVMTVCLILKTVHANYEYPTELK